jgi:hypothetical protein
MIEIASGNIEVGVKYTVGNITTPPGTGTITYNSTVYNVGLSFIGQLNVTTYVASDTSATGAKVYQDDAEISILTQNTAIIEEEITPYPGEAVSILTQQTSTDYETGEIVYPEYVQILMQATIEGRRNRSQIIKRIN